MCNLSQGIEDKGVKKGIALSKAIDAAFGIDLNLFITIIRMIDRLKMPLEEAVIAAKVPEELRENYVKVMENYLVIIEEPETLVIYSQ